VARLLLQQQQQQLRGRRQRQQQVSQTLQQQQQQRRQQPLQGQNRDMQLVLRLQQIQQRVMTTVVHLQLAVCLGCRSCLKTCWQG
jgi:Fe-S-cluster-containing dehydrogenase component